MSDEELDRLCRICERDRQGVPLSLLEHRDLAFALRELQRRRAGDAKALELCDELPEDHGAYTSDKGALSLAQEIRDALELVENEVQNESGE